MTGRIVYEPPAEEVHARLYRCPDMPESKDLRDGTIWQCDECGQQWEKWSGSQYNEHFDSWRRKP